MLIDLKLQGKTVLVVGGGAEALRKVQNFLDSGATIWVISRTFSVGIQKLAEEKKLQLMKTEISDAQAFITSLNPKPDILLAVTDNPALNSELALNAKSAGSRVYSVDDISKCDFIFPAVAKVGDVKIAVSTAGKSPAMARVLRERIEKLISKEDLLEIELQSSMREVLKRKIPDQKQRSILLYEILNNDKIKQVLIEGKLVEATEMAKQLLESKIHVNKKVKEIKK